MRKCSHKETKRIAIIASIKPYMCHTTNNENVAFIWSDRRFALLHKQTKRKPDHSQDVFQQREELWLWPTGATGGYFCLRTHHLSHMLAMAWCTNQSVRPHPLNIPAADCVAEAEDEAGATVAAAAAARVRHGHGMRAACISFVHECWRLSRQPFPRSTW